MIAANRLEVARAELVEALARMVNHVSRTAKLKRSRARYIEEIRTTIAGIRTSMISSGPRRGGADDFACICRCESYPMAAA